MTLAQLEQDDYRMRCDLADLDIPEPEKTPEMKQRFDDLTERWCDIIPQMTATPADTFAGVQIKLRYLVDCINMGADEAHTALALSIGSDIERLTGEPLGKVRKSTASG